MNKEQSAKALLWLVIKAALLAPDIVTAETVDAAARKAAFDLADGEPGACAVATRMTAIHSQGQGDRRYTFLDHFWPDNCAKSFTPVASSVKDEILSFVAEGLEEENKDAE